MGGPVHILIIRSWASSARFNHQAFLSGSLCGPVSYQETYGSLCCASPPRARPSLYSDLCSMVTSSSEKPAVTTREKVELSDPLPHPIPLPAADPPPERPVGFLLAACPSLSPSPSFPRR